MDGETPPKSGIGEPDRYNPLSVHDSETLGAEMAKQFHMTVEENVFYAKRNVVDSIWKEANIEGIAVTFPETKEVFEGRAVAGMTVDETIAINNLKHAWQFLFDTLDAPVDLGYVRQMNRIVGHGLIPDAGQLRSSSVSIGGTSWRPEIPDADSARDGIARIAGKAEEDPLDAALAMFSLLTRGQLFLDGNKRTAQLVANKMLISKGKGILAIPPDGKMAFNDLLIGFYESGDRTALCGFLVETSIDGLAG